MLPAFPPNRFVGCSVAWEKRLCPSTQLQHLSRRRTIESAGFSSLVS